MWYSAAVAGLFCAFRDTLPHISVVTSGYSCLSISSNQSGYSPLTSGNSKVFLPTELPFTGYLLFFF